jgi:hypothetical protein
LAQNNPQNYPLPALGSESAFLSGLLKNLIAEYEAEATSSHIKATCLAGQTRVLDDLDLHQTTAATKIQAGLIITDFLNSPRQERKNLVKYLTEVVGKGEKYLQTSNPKTGKTITLCDLPILETIIPDYFQPANIINEEERMRLFKAIVRRSDAAISDHSRQNDVLNGVPPNVPGSTVISVHAKKLSDAQRSTASMINTARLI